MSIHEDHLGTLWIGTWGGLNKLDRAAGRFTRFVNNAENPHSLSENRVWTIYEDRSGTLWIGTNGGSLNRFDRTTGKFTRFASTPKNPHSLSSNNVLSICEDRTGTLWLGTSGGGLNRLDRPDTLLKNLNEEAGWFTRFTEKDGLPDNVIYGILEDDQGRLWLSTNTGLSCFDPRTETFRNYDATDGLQSNEFNTGAYHKMRNGEMVFGGINGFNVFHPDSIKDNAYIPPVVITAFKRYNTGDVQGIAIEEKCISTKRSIQLSHKDNVLSFEFAALSFRNSSKNQYAYKLDGFNKNWIQLGTKREVTFTNLDPGEYTLRVKGSNNDGVWNEEGSSLKIIITPPWWKTKWAFTLYVLCITGLLYALRRYELNRLRLKNQLQIELVEAAKMKELDHLKSRFFANISHEFRTPLTLILGPVEQMRGKTFKGNLDEAYDIILRNSRRLLRLINQLLDLARLESGGMSLQARPENIVSFLKGLVLSFASAAERKRIELRITAEEESLIVYFDRDKMEKIVSNLLSNALKFTPERGRVEVRISTVGATSPVAPGPVTPGLVAIGPFAPAPFAPTIKITVQDTGPGIPQHQLDKIFDRFYQVDASHTREHEGTGIGLALTKELVELHHGEISVESEVGRGTMFIVRLPLGKEHLRPEEVVERDQLPVSSDQLSVVSDQIAKFEDRKSKLEDRESSIEHRASSIENPASSIQDQASNDKNLILVIEDNRDVRAYIRQYLEPAFKVIDAVDGVDGATRALETIPDLIICDVMMPRRDGYEVCRILKTDEKTSHVPIIMLTAKADRESKVQGLETGADDYLIKPFDSRELLARVRNLIKLRQQLRERFGREITLQPKDIAINSMDEQLQRVMHSEEHISIPSRAWNFARRAGMSRRT
jgi:signal transduction histidine kinase/DNA-binding response OmpR family regulator/sugar lactone lactonase YvrE